VKPVSSASTRLWEIDTLRGVAVLAMIFFHFMWDLWFLGLTTQQIGSGGWQVFARSIGGTFTFLLGVSLVLSDASARRKGIDPRPIALKRAGVILLCALAISVGTYFFVGNDFVRFGILHHAAFAMALGLLFVGAPVWLTGIVGAMLVAIGFSIWGMRVDHPWLIPLGVPQTGVGMVDYYPLLPWFGVALLGVAAGRLLYPDGKRTFGLSDLSDQAPVRLLRWLGRNSLEVYLIHQPVMIGVLMAGRFFGWW
jgi:uncharacterized membrane protein